MMWAREAFGHRATCRPWHEWLSATESSVLRAFFPLLDLLADRVGQAAHAAGLRVAPGCVERSIATHSGRSLFELLARIVLVEYRAACDDDCCAREEMPVFAEFSAGLLRFTPLATLHARYPLLESRVDRLLERTLRHLATVVSRLAADFAALQAMTTGTSLLRELEFIEEVGDPHRDGACVTLVAVGSVDGSCVRFIYKPHPVTADVAFAAFLHEVAKDSGLEFRTPWYLQRDEHGWVEHIPQVDCADHAGVERYYTRLGWLLAVVHALNGSDIHAGNVIAHGEHPVIVDLECLLSPDTRASAQRRSAGRPWITSTGMVPMCRLAGAAYRGLDSSAFSGRNGDVHVYRDWNLLDTRTTRPVIARSPMRTSGRRNIPSLDGAIVEPLESSASFVGGFNAGYRHLLANKAALLGSAAFARLRDIPVRVVLRNTGEYLKLLYESTHPDLLRDAAMTSALWDTLPVRATDPALRSHELRDLDDGIVPRFSVGADQFELSDSTGQGIGGVLAATGFDSLLDHWEHHLSASDAGDQARLLEQCLGTRQLFAGQAGAVPAQSVPHRVHSHPPALLEPVASYLVSRAVRTAEGPTWFRTAATAAGACLVAPMDWSFSHGLFGMVFAAHHALQRIRHPGLEKLAAELVHRIRQGAALEGRAARSSNARAGIVVLPVLMQDPRWGIDAGHYAQHFEVHQRHVLARMGTGTAPRATLDLLATLATEPHASAAAPLSDQLAASIACDATTGTGFWNGSGVVHLGLAKHAAARPQGIGERPRLDQAAVALEAATDAPFSVADGIGWLQLAIALHDVGVDVARDVESLVSSLADRVHPWCLGELHGMGGWMDVLSSLSSRGLVADDRLQRVRAAHDWHLNHALDAATRLETPSWSSADLAHGWAGVVLRLCGVSAISSAPPLGQL